MKRWLGATLVLWIAIAVPSGGSMAANRGTAPLLVVERSWPPTLSVVVQIHSGATADPLGQQGRASLCWATAARAAGSLDRKAFAQKLEALGARLDVDVGRRTTQIAISGLAEHADLLFGLLGDVLARPRFDPADFERAREQQIAGILARRDDDEATAAEAIVRYALRGHRAGRPVDGDEASLTTLTLDACRAEIQRTVATARVDVGVAGALSHAEAKRLARQHLGAVMAARKTSTVMPPAEIGLVRDGRRLLIIDHPGRNAAQVVLAVPTPGVAQSDLTGLAVADAILGGAFTSRLSHQIRELRGWTYSIGSSLQQARGHGLWTLSWAPRNAVVGKSLDLAVRHLELAAQDGATRGEIAFARDYLRGSQRQSTETAPEILATQLRARALGLPDDWIAGFEARLAKVDSKAVRNAMGVLAPKDVCVVVVGDAAKLRPQLAALGSGFAVEVIPRGGLPEATKMPGKPPSPTPARPQVAPEADEEIGPEFDEKGEVVDAPAPITPTAADDDGDDDADGDDGDGGNSADDETEDDGDAMRSGAAS